MYDKPHVPPVLCPIPWMSQSYRANGDVRICCQAQHGPTGGILKDEEGNIEETISKISKILTTSSINHEIIVINDHSNDSTMEILQLWSLFFL